MSQSGQIDQERFEYMTSVRALIRKSLQKTTMHGLPNIVDSSSPILTILWTSCLLASSCVCSFLVVQSVQNYLKFEVVSQTSTVLEIPANFPQVTVCNLNPFLTDKGVEFANRLLKENQKSARSATDYLEMMFLRYYLGSNAANSAYNDEFRKSLGLTLDDMLISCVFNSYFCNSSDFEWYYSNMHGNCYRFNSRGTYTTQKPGYYNGLQMELYVSRPTNLSSIGYSVGAHIIVNHHTSIPTMSEGIDVKTGEFTTIAVERIFSEQLPEPYSECKEDIEKINTTFIQSTLAKYTSYSQVKCFDSCLQVHIQKTCGCQDAAKLLINSNYPYCLNMSQIKCSFEQYAIFYSHDVEAVCSKDCPLECTGIKYTYTISSSDYPSEPYYSLLLQKPAVQKHFSENVSAVTYETLKSNLVAINVFYQDLSYSLISHDAKLVFIDLIASIGGTLGLFSGISFLSFVELIELVIKIAEIGVQSTQLKHGKQKVNQSK